MAAFNFTRGRLPMGSWMHCILALSTLALFVMFAQVVRLGLCPSSQTGNSLRQPEGRQLPCAENANGSKAWLVNRTELHLVARHEQECGQYKGSGLKLNKHNGLVAPVVVVSHNRPGYLTKMMVNMLRYWSADPSNARKFPIFISIDGDSQRALSLAVAFSQAQLGIQVMNHEQDASPCLSRERPDDRGYCMLSLHYKTLLRVFFTCLESPSIMFLEEDLQIAPDYFPYFEATYPLLQKDPSLWCISAWNDHGQAGRVLDPTALMRTDVMPGLGWMLLRPVGLELYPGWPQGYWDEWMRRNEVKKGRQCIFPEVSRTVTFGENGTSQGMFFKDHLGKMVLNSDVVDWKRMDLSYLLEPTYNTTITRLIAASRLIRRPWELEEWCGVNATCKLWRDVAVVYNPGGNPVIEGQKYWGFADVAEIMPPMMRDAWFDNPRGSYYGIVIVRCGKRRVFLVPGPKVPHPPPAAASGNEKGKPQG